LRINGAQAGLDEDLRFNHVIELVEGSNGIWVIAFDRASNLSWLYREVHLDTVPPPAPDGEFIQISEPESVQITVSGEPGAVEANSTVEIINLDTAESTHVAATPEGGFHVSIGAQAGNQLAILVQDQAGNQSETWET